MNPGTGTQFLGVGSRLSTQAKPGELATSPAAFETRFLLESSLWPTPEREPAQSGAGRGWPCQASGCQRRHGCNSSCYYSRETLSARHTLAEDKSQPTHNTVALCLSPAACGQEQVKLQETWNGWS